MLLFLPADDTKKGTAHRSPLRYTLRTQLPLNEHGHYHVYVVFGADGFDDAGAGGVGGFEDDFRFADDAEDIDEIASVEGYLGFFAFDDGIDFTGIFTDFFGAGGYGEFTGGGFPIRTGDQPDDTAAVPGKNRGCPGGSEEFGNLDGDTGRMALGNELLILRERSLDKL